MKKKVTTIALILILSFSFALTTLPSVKAAAHTDITVAQAYAMIYDNSYPNLVIMDVRTASDYNAGHIPGAINVPVLPPSPFDFTALNAWINSTEGQSHKNHEIIVYCASGTRSNLAANNLDSNNFTKVYDMRGAYPAWTAAGYPTILFSSGFEDSFNSWTATSGGVSIVSSPVYSGTYAMKCSDTLGSQASKSIGTQSKIYTEAEFCFDNNIAGEQTLIAYFNGNGNPTVSMGISVQSGRVFAFVQTNLPSYSYSQYELTSLFPGTWNKFTLDASASSATIYLNDQQLAAASLANIPATASVSVGMFWEDRSYTGNLYIDCVQIGTSAPQPTSATIFNGFEDGFNSWTATQGGVSVVSSPVYAGNYSMKCSDPWGSQATESIGIKSETLTEAEFSFDNNIAGEQTLIAYFNANGNPTVSMGISVQSGRVFAYVQAKLPSYSYSQYELTGITAGTWYKFALDASATSATIYMYNQKLTSISQTNIPATASVSVGMFWGDGSYTGNLYIDNVQIGVLPPLALPAGTNRLYWEGGEGMIAVPASWPGGSAVPTSSLKVEASHIIAAPNGADEANIVISVAYKSGYLPVAYFTTNPDALTWVRMLLSGLPVSAPTNSKAVSNSDLIVEMHGNRITAELKVPQTGVMWSKVGGGYTTVTIPAFKFELDKVGGSVHVDTTQDLSGYSKASNYAGYEDQVGFNGNGVFTCSAWTYTAKPMTNCFIIAHGITTYVPPPLP